MITTLSRLAMALTPEFSLPPENRRVLLVERPNGIPEPRHFRIERTAVPEAGDGQLLVRNIYLSVDPAQRGWASDLSNYSAPVPLGTTMRALALGQVVQSHIQDVAAGTYVYGWLGWQDYAVVSREAILTVVETPAVPLSAYAGPLGINGITADLALSLHARPNKGETLLVSAAAGSVGSLVGQLARHAGCRAIGLAGGPDKVERCSVRYGFEALDYKATDLASAFESVAPDGFDIYFDNVGGATLDLALRYMRIGGRIVQCGTVSIDSWSPVPTGPRVEREVLTRRLCWSGFIVFDHQALFADTIVRLATLIRSGDLLYDEDIDDGIEAAPGALADLYAGRNQGKKLIFLN